MIDHMPTPPMVESATATPSRSHALGESITCGAIAPFSEVMVVKSPAYIYSLPLVALSRSRGHPLFG
jgi:hypothetical protein